MAAARALPWLLAGVVLTGCARTGPGLRGANAADALVDLRALDPSIRIEMPYATPHNFAGVALYSVARCLLRRDVAERLVRFEPLPTEWWHFDGPSWERYELLDRPLTE